MKTECLGRASGTLEFSDYHRAKLKKFLLENGDCRLLIQTVASESPNQRAFYHGAVITLWAYLDGKNYKDHIVLEQLHEIAKREFNGDIIIVNGKEERVAKSTKGQLNNGYLERVIHYLVENYGVDETLVFDTELYKKFRDTIYPFSKYDTYIDYLKELHYLD